MKLNSFFDRKQECLNWNANKDPKFALGKVLLAAAAAAHPLPWIHLLAERSTFSYVDMSCMIVYPSFSWLIPLQFLLRRFIYPFYSLCDNTELFQRLHASFVPHNYCLLAVICLIPQKRSLQTSIAAVARLKPRSEESVSYCSTVNTPKNVETIIFTFFSLAYFTIYGSILRWLSNGYGGSDTPGVMFSKAARKAQSSKSSFWPSQ